MKIEYLECYLGYVLFRILESRDIFLYLSLRYFFILDLFFIIFVFGGIFLFDCFLWYGLVLMFEFLWYNFENLFLDNIELDVVVYIYCNEWLFVVDEWIERNCLCWFFGIMIVDIVDMGCDLVLKGVYGSEN